MKNLTWDELKKNIIDKKEVKNIPKQNNISINKIFTGVASYFLGDLEVIKKLYNKEEDLEDIEDSVILSENRELNKNIKNFFTISTYSDQRSYFYWAKIDEKVDFLFIPTFLIYQDVAQEDRMGAFDDNNQEFISKILNQISSNNTDWIKLGNLEVPSSSLYLGETNMPGLSFKEISDDSYKRLSTLHKQFEIYGVISKREELIKLYNSPCKDINYVNTDMLYESNNDLPKDKAFHGILLLGKDC